MLSKSKLNFIKSLHLKKFRKEHGLFIIEGYKSILEFINSDYKIDSIFYTNKLNQKLAHLGANINLFEINESDLLKISTLKNPQHILALVAIPLDEKPSQEVFNNKISLILDNIQDPGNLGTIIRTADWFGIKNIICSPGTAEIYNPKTIQSTMGSLSRVNIWHCDLKEFLNKNTLPVFGALLNGDNIYKVQWPKEGFIVLGNEGHGIQQELLPLITNQVTIPCFGGAESLNVAISAAIFCSEISRTK